jgi:hypothetical protein
MTTQNAQLGSGRKPWIVTSLCLVSAVLAFSLWRDHRSHVLQAVPYLLLLACPIIHLFMHRGHRHGHREAA